MFFSYQYCVPELIYRLEPHILRVLTQLNIDEIAITLTNLISTRSGNDDIRKIISAILINNTEKINKDKNLKALYLSLNNKLFKRKTQLSEFNDLNINLTKTLINKIIEEKPTLETVNTLLHNLENKKIYNSTYLDILLTKFLKCLEKIDFSGKIDKISNSVSNLVMFNVLSKNLSEILLLKLKNYYNQPKVSISGLLGEEISEKNPFKQIIIEKNMTANEKNLSYDRILILKLLSEIKLLWSYLNTNFTLKTVKTMDFELINIATKNINEYLTQLKLFTGVIKLSKNNIEIIFQINMIFDSLPYNLINQKINLNLIWDSRLQIIQNQKERCRIFGDQLLIYEKKLFFSKYQNFLKKYQNISNYFVHFILETDINKKNLIFINETNDFYYDKEGNSFENSIIKLRNQLLEKLGVKQYTISFIEILNRSENLENNELSIESLLEEILPKIEIKNDEKFEKNLEILKELRNKYKINRSNLGGQEIKILNKNEEIPLVSDSDESDEELEEITDEIEEIEKYFGNLDKKFKQK